MQQAIQLFRTGAMTIAWLMVVPSLIVLLAALEPIVPWLRIYAVSAVPNHISWLFLWSIAGLFIGILAYSRGRTTIAFCLVAVGSLATLATCGVILRLLYVAQSNGARVDVFKALSLREFSDGARPDETEIYSRPQGEALSLDIYRPRKAAPGTLSPVMLAVHGGGFFEGSRTFGAANMRWYADRGWTVISIDYRLATPTRPTWNLAERDVECAMAWTAANATRLGVDIKRLTLTGGSAGGSLAMAAAYKANAKRSTSDCAATLPHVAAVVTKVPLIDAIGSWYHPGELQPLQRSYLTRYIGGPPQQYPDRYVAIDLRNDQWPTNPPTLILGGSEDQMISPEGAEDFTLRANTLGLKVRHLLFPFSGHDFNTSFDGIANQALLQIVAQYMIDHRAGPVTPATKPATQIADR
jgi:acetyl esterase/lipase